MISRLQETSPCTRVFSYQNSSERAHPVLPTSLLPFDWLPSVSPCLLESRYITPHTLLFTSRFFFFWTTLDLMHKPCTHIGADPAVFCRRYVSGTLLGNERCKHLGFWWVSALRRPERQSAFFFSFGQVLPFTCFRILMTFRLSCVCVHEPGLRD